MGIRIISALVAIPLFLFIVINKGMILDFSVLILSLIAIHEFFNAFEKIQIFPYKKIGFFSIIFMSMITFYGLSLKWIMLWFFICTLMILMKILFSKPIDITASSITAIGMFYIVFFMYHIVFVAHLSQYNDLIWLVFIVAFATDTFAYFSGYLLGSKKLCPTISPKKTIEGAVGGVLGSVMISALFGYYVLPQIFIHCIMIGFVGSVLGQIGDLTASIFKRYTGIKDYGKLMPGHGGVLDRFDSILFTAPVVYYYMMFFLL
ncbi:phosphatidate cytidylyltransferase [Inediibacterium massiliense]|uniref:phosphatidate cytidylyltransferase n=1 Tax=Inediibacterium massiliense TaxID=1658111 RepID=UPI0006B47C37|nr:phosphatidate cytidylyltransferase [Inediibacterium massiliense]